MNDIETLQTEIEWETAALTWRRKIDLPQVRRQVQEHISEMGREGQYIRLLALLDQLMDAKEDLFWRFKRYEANAAAGRPYVERAIIAAFIPEHERNVEKIRREVDYLRGVLFRPDRKRTNGDRLTDEQIERARVHPISDLIEVRHNLARCISGTHQDKNPSMDCRNNFAYCHACGFHADAIGVYQKLHGATFRDAVKILS